MSSSSLGTKSLPLFPLTIGVWATSVALAPTLEWKGLLILPAMLILLVGWLCLNPQKWVLVFLCALIALPPLPIYFGDSAVHPALLVLALGLFVSVFGLHRWHLRKSSTSKASLLFIIVLLLSIVPAAIESGTEIALGSFLRVLLFAAGPFTFFYASHGPGAEKVDGLRYARILFRVGTASAIFACLDFYFQLPTPAGFGQQFVWLDEGVFRRAQGVFYEASTLGNFCAFFLIMVMVALRSPAGRRFCSAWELSLGAVVFFVTLIFSYSRGSVLNVIVAGLTLALLQRRQIWRLMLVLGVCGTICVSLVSQLFPAFAQSYLVRLWLSLRYIWSTPNGVLSGRLDSWTQLTRFIISEPMHILYGVGYKTLAYSQVAGSNIIPDNTYLSILIETGVLGLSAFVLLNLSILRTSLLGAQSQSESNVFFGRWMFCFWIGELTQMLSGDLITYWRVLPLYFWVLSQVRWQTPGRCVGTHL